MSSRMIIVRSLPGGAREPTGTGMNSSLHALDS
jgi:hypothetical protein